MLVWAVLLMNVFSLYAGVKLSRALFTEKNNRKALALGGMWVVMYVVYLIGVLYFI